MRKIDWSAMMNEVSNGGKKSYADRDVDVNLYTPKLKEDGTYDAIIRFLPSPDTDIPWVVMHNHGYQASTGKWVIENCPKTLDKKCPICESASKIWNAGDEEAARRRFKKTSVYSNVLVVRDPQNPENEGKVFVFRYGKKMLELIKNKLRPPSTLDEPLNVFDYADGANFKLKIRSKIITDAKGNKKPVPNYDASEFTTSSALDDNLVAEIEQALIPLKAYISQDKFLSYSELEKKVRTAEGEASRDSDDEESTTEVVETKKAPAPKAQTSQSSASNDFFSRLRQNG